MLIKLNNSRAEIPCLRFAGEIHFPAAKGDSRHQGSFPALICVGYLLLLKVISNSDPATKELDTKLSHCYENNRRNSTSVQLRRKYNPDFKRNAVLFSEKEGRTVTEIAENLDISKDGSPPKSVPVDMKIQDA